MHLPPVEVLFNWPTPNYDNPVTRGNALLVVNSVFAALATITVGLRLYTRLVIKRWFGIDDVFILFALFFTIGLTAVVLLANQEYGWDRHVYDIRFSVLEPAAKIAMTAKIVFTLAATFTRLSLHCFYYRLISDTGKTWFKWLVHVNVAYTFGIFISFPFIAVFMCTPIQNYWIVGAPEDTCMDEGIATLVCGVISCVADLATTLTPLPLILGLQMPLRQRFGAAVLFSFGLIVTVAGIVRTWFIYESLIKETDQTWYAYPLWIAAAIEIDLGVICASAPAIRPLFEKIPFSLSETLSRGISCKKSTGYASKPATDDTLLGSRVTLNASATFSSRKSVAIRAVPELIGDRGRSYELKHWDDIERSVRADERSRGNQEAILEVENQATKEKGST